MKTIGRNDPCPCGSGKKFKRCCGAEGTAAAADLRYYHIRRLDAESENLILRFARQLYGEDVVEHAWGDFFFEDEIPFELSHPDSEFFGRWFTFDWRPEEEETLAEHFLTERGNSIGNELRRFIEATIDSPYSFWQVLESKSSAGMTLRDILRRSELRVTERAASGTLERGHIIYARVVEMDGVSFMMGCGAQIFPAASLGQFMEVRSSLEKEQPAGESALRTETLLDFEDELRWTYFLMANDLQKRWRDIRNTDGDPLLFQTLTYEIPSFDAAFHSLKDLEQRVTRQSDADLLTTAETNPAGEPVKIHISWLKTRANPDGRGHTSLALLTITQSALVVEVNSEKRSKRIQKEMTKRLGEKAVLMKVETKTREAIWKELEGKERQTTAREETESERFLRESPEAKALMRRLMDEHWTTWPDIPLPALRGMTPRQASKDAEGREMLESLLMEFELRNSREKDENLRVNVPKLRRDLGLRSE